ncbi:MAG: glycosyltransferase family 4 protein [Proteobacteria bacterium]|nr:glycosyltransferase family 4 protein [Pseudomonadota bacterium]
MKIGLAIYNFDPKKGGAERYAYDLATRLVQRGHEICVFCGQGMKTEGIKLIRLNAMPFPRWLRTLSFALKHRAHMRTSPPDVMLGFGNTFEADVYQSHGGVQRIWMEREIASYEDPKERSYKAFLLRNSINQRIQEWIAEYPIRTKRCSRIIAISDMLKTHIAGHFSIKPDSIDVVYNGVDTQQFAPASSRADGPLRILFSAGNFRLKGLLPLLLAAGEVSKERRDFRVRIMGRGRRERYEQVIRALSIGDCVTFLGEQAYPETVYRDAQILAHPTFYDACSLTTMEAMASGLPVITTRWNGASSLISEQEGYVIDEPFDIVGMVTAIKALFNQDFRDSMGKNARIKLESYTMDQNAAAMEKILLEAR